MDRSFLKTFELDDSCGRATPVYRIRIGDNGAKKLDLVAAEIGIPKATLARRLLMRALTELSSETSALRQKDLA